MPDSSAIDQALVDKLSGDTTLTALMPDGVWMDEGPAGKQQFVIVSVVDAHDAPIFEGRGTETVLYAVEARELSSVAVKNIKAAAARIDALLDPPPPAARATLTIAGYGFQLMRRESRVRLTDVDAVDSSIRWQRRGGQYEVVVAPIGT
jgi:hypothetical protein